jgi:ribosomal protein S18 acetylase RimI-like enzyme
LGSQCPSADLHRAELASLYVLAAFQRQGIGSALLSQAETIAKNVGESLWLSVNAQNVAALQFYARRAYESIGECYFELGKSRHKNVVLVHGSA